MKLPAASCGISAKENKHQLSLICIRSLVFPAPGRFEFRLLMEGHLIAQKDFSVMQMPPHQIA
jgi:hypothetical protein